MAQSLRTDEGRATRLAILDFIAEYKSEHGYMPTQLAIQDGLNLGYGTCRWHIQSLVDQGYLSYQRHDFARTLRVSRKDRDRLE